MAAYYRVNLHPFADELAQTYPQRAKIVAAALTAHSTGGEASYLLYIPVFIAQADGLLEEATGVEFAMRDAAKVLQAKYASNREIFDLLSSTFGLKNPEFRMTSKVRKNQVQVSGSAFTAFNRHQVMHGHSSDYGTEINSPQAFSFLAFAGLHIPAVLRND